MDNTKSNFGGEVTEKAQSEGAEIETRDERISFDEILKDKEYQSEFDKRIAKALDTAKAKWNEETNKKLSEAEKLAKMNAEQKAEYEKQQQEADYQKRLAEVIKRELQATAKDTLLSKDLPIILAEALNYSDAESCNKSIEAIEKAFNIAVESKVNEKLKSRPPKSPSETISKISSRDLFIDAIKENQAKR